MVRRSLLLAAVLSLLTACARSSQGAEPNPSPRPIVHVTVDPSTAPSPDMQATPPRTLDLGSLPQEGVAIGFEREHVVVLVDLNGHVLSRLPRFTLEYGNGSVPGVVVLSRGPWTYRLDTERDRLVRTRRPPSGFIDQGDGDVSLRPPIGSMVEGARAGSWRWAERSPDGSRWLAQWSGECESPAVFLVRDGETPVSITGPRSVAHSVEAFALGWSADGRAIAQLLEPACGRAYSHPGVYAFTEPGRGEFVFRTRGLAFARMWGAA
jgi:hypothetical protein